MRPWAAALYGAVVTLVGQLGVAVAGDETLADVTQAEWLVIVLAVLTSGAVAEWLGRKLPPGADAEKAVQDPE